ncbi:hypothetical protein VSS37_20485 [Candidatus Thiothrix sp. Deng01]|uniref:Uncharacterized protein n=1 Tax=Candidatus Thiothrix phosphatis TaxID=3112415 RepID=A0ABU6D2T8_9GAMM|nr:hypothetical protein [Candidatus Thiothrix sp. Deng01]MEB4593367.1 hypothetical protein [Candidatus Thiothrix sp. Deng01]
MRIRLKTKWNKQEREVSLEDTVGVLAFNTWKIGMHALLEIENENFQTDTQMQRVMVMEEIMAFMIHVLDRIAYEVLSDEDRGALISTFALKIADHVQDNARDFGGPGDYRNPFINKLNQRMNDYAETSWGKVGQEPGFSMGLLFGNFITEALGPRDRKWVLDYIQRVLMPEILSTYKKVITRLGFLQPQATV